MSNYSKLALIKEHLQAPENTVCKFFQNRLTFIFSSLDTNDRDFLWRLFSLVGVSEDEDMKEPGFLDKHFFGLCQQISLDNAVYKKFGHFHRKVKVTSFCLTTFSFQEKKIDFFYTGDADFTYEKQYLNFVVKNDFLDFLINKISEENSGNKDEI